MKLKLAFLSVLVLILTGCILDPYTNSRYGKEAVKAWFNSEALGDKRKEIESIRKINNIDCKYKEKYKEHYVFKCDIQYNPIGETKIPLSTNKKIEVFAVFTPKKEKFAYRVYNSSSKDGIWKDDENL